MNKRELFNLVTGVGFLALLMLVYALVGRSAFAADSNSQWYRVDFYLDHASMWTVTKTADTNDGVCNIDCSLREAIIAANGHPGDDTITIPAGLYTLALMQTPNAQPELLFGVDNQNGGGTIVILPVSKALTQTSIYTVTNLGSATANLAHFFYDGGYPGGSFVYNFVDTLGSGQSWAYVLNDISGVPMDFIGDVVISSDQPITGIASTSSSGTGEDAAATGDLDITDNVTLNGAGQGLTFIDGNSLDRVFHIIASFGGSTPVVVLSNMTIQNGMVTGTTAFEGYGGGIFAHYGTVTLTNTTVTSNSAYVGGGISDYGAALTINNGVVSQNTANFAGGIHGTGNVNINNTTVNNNVAIQGTGGIINNLGTLTLANSTVNNNSSTSGVGGIHSDSIAVIKNSTISGNTTLGNSGGINNNGTMTITNSTLAANQANALDGGIGNFGGLVTIRNTIVAGNIGSDCLGSLVSLGYNLIGSTLGCTFTASTGDKLNLNANLEALAYNGGSTQTHALLPNSPAIDAGNPAPPGSGGNACEAIDQRGVIRSLGYYCDMGAYESNFFRSFTNFLPLLRRGP